MSKNNVRSDTISRTPALWIVFGVLSMITLAAYWNSFKVPLVFDDLLTIQRNADVRFANFYYSGSRALLFALFALNYLWTGQEVWSYHLVNLLLHLMNGFLLFVLAERVFAHIDNDQARCRKYATLAS